MDDAEINATLTPADQDIARWTHGWMRAALLILERIEQPLDDGRLAASIGERDALGLVLVDTLRNVLRGAERLLGMESEPVRRFKSAVPRLVDVRDTMEHFDEYLRGEGKRQDSTTQSVKSGVPRVAFSSSGGERVGHVLTITVAGVKGKDGKDGKDEVLQFGALTSCAAARELTLAVVQVAGLDDERHHGECPFCFGPIVDAQMPW